MKKSMKYLLLTLLLNTTHLSAAEWAISNLTIVDEYAVPAYTTLNENANKLVTASNTFCSDLGENTFKELKGNFHSTMDAWQSIQALRTGPAGKNMRSFRLEMWPDRSNAASKHIRTLVINAIPGSLDPENFSKASVAVQGLSAMERVIYAKNITFEDFKIETGANFKCQLIVAISHNVKTIAKDLLEAWQGSYRDIIAKPSKENDFFETDKEAAAQFLNELSTQLQVIIEQKIGRPIDGDKLRLTRAESWRSGRSLRNILLNLASAKKLYQIGFAPNIKNQTLLKKQQELFNTSITLGKNLEIPLKDAYTNHLESLNTWIESLKALKVSISTELPEDIDIPLGFNSLDGD